MKENQNVVVVCFNFCFFTHTHTENVEYKVAISQVVGTIPQHRQQLPRFSPPLHSCNEAPAIGRNALF